MESSRHTRPRRSLRLVTAAFVLAGASLIGTAAAANAATGCGEYSFGFEGTRLLNDGISDSAGPFVISMPAGSYDITLHSFDDHAAHPGQIEQTQEQWYFTLDSGYTSPVSSDVADDTNSSVDTFPGAVIEDATAITVHHLGEGGINSVAPMCVGFTTVSSPPVVIEPKTIVVPPETVVPGPPSPVDESTEITDVPVEVKQAVEVKAPPVILAAPAPAPVLQLAITGPSAPMSIMIVLGAVLMVVGGALLVEERRRSLTS